MMSVESESVWQTVRPNTMVTYGRGEGIAGGDTHWCRVIHGMALRSTIRPSGRRQIVGLLAAGVFFGFSDDDNDDEPAFTVTAVADCTVIYHYLLVDLERLAANNPVFGRALRDAVRYTVAGLEEQIIMLGRTTSLKKVGSFIALISRGASDGDPIVALPMSRYDMADYLGISVETVSRCLTEFKRRGAIRLHGPRRLQILDLKRLTIEDGQGAVQ